MPDLSFWEVFLILLPISIAGTFAIAAYGGFGSNVRPTRTIRTIPPNNNFDPPKKTPEWLHKGEKLGVLDFLPGGSKYDKNND